VWLQVTAEEVLRRTAGDTTRPLLNTANPEARVRELMTQRRAAYEQADWWVDTGGQGVEQVAERIVSLLAQDPRTCCLVPSTELVVPVHAQGRDYPVIVGHGLLQRAGEVLGALGMEPGLGAVVTAEGACEQYAERVVRALGAAGWQAEVLVVPDGEASKSARWLAELWNRFVELGLDRRSVVVAVGGGVIGDLAGMAAATYMRGVRLVQVPTTLLAQIDSSIGGKTAIDLPAGKNLAGAFHQPIAVLSSLETLDTLAEQQVRDGLAEGIKHGLILDRELFEWLEENWARVLEREPWAVRYFVARNMQIKGSVVRQDPQEAYLRALLNFGHTVGHAVEAAGEDWSVSHGQAVAVGMVAELRLTERLGLTHEGLAERVAHLVEQVGLPLRAPGQSLLRAQEALRVDKKFVEGSVKLPVVVEVGRSAIMQQVAVSELTGALRLVME
ncbi:MAG: 3-dehydroquinate synthase, partial [Armatimonadetes bacterium]|nr:3-dehydroquinate synthase [Armatimonadota bacterium]